MDELGSLEQPWLKSPISAPGHTLVGICLDFIPFPGCSMACFLKLTSFTKYESVPHKNTCTSPQNISTCSNRHTCANMWGNMVWNLMEFNDLK